MTFQHEDLPPALKDLQEKLVYLRSKGTLNLQNGDIGYASAPSNIALIKYWGKAPKRNQIPVNSSLSYTLGGFRSFTKVSALGRFFPTQEPFNPQYPKFKNQLYLNHNQKDLPSKMENWIQMFLSSWAEDIALKIESFNNFPTACGIASSASGYAALIGALGDLLQINKHFNEKEVNYWLTEWARLGSGSATRSCLSHHEDSFVAWHAPTNLQQGFSHTEKIESSPHFKKLNHCVFILDDKEKEIPSSEGHLYAHTSPFQAIRVSGVARRMKLMMRALELFDFELLRILSEEDALSMHSIIQTTSKPAHYITQQVAQALALFISERDAQKALALWTLDAGPNIHVLYLPEALPWLKSFHSLLCQELNTEVKVLCNQFKEGLMIGKEHYDNLLNQKILSDFM